MDLFETVFQFKTKGQKTHVPFRAGPGLLELPRERCLHFIVNSAGQFPLCPHWWLVEANGWLGKMREVRMGMVWIRDAALAEIGMVLTPLL